MRTVFVYWLSVRSDTAPARRHAAPTTLPLADHKILPEQGDPGISSKSDPLELTPASPVYPTRSCTMTLTYHVLTPQPTQPRTMCIFSSFAT